MHGKHGKHGKQGEQIHTHGLRGRTDEFGDEGHHAAGISGLPPRSKAEKKVQGKRDKAQKNGPGL